MRPAVIGGNGQISVVKSTDTAFIFGTKYFKPQLKLCIVTPDKTLNT